MKLIFRILLSSIFAISLQNCGGFDIEDAVSLFNNIQYEIGMEPSTLTPAQIKEEQNRISKLNPDEKRKAYKDLQWRVPYQNQRANIIDPDGSCNVTALSGAFAYYGENVNPDELSKEIEFKKRVNQNNNCIFDKRNLCARNAVAKDHGLQSVEYDCRKPTVATSANKIDEFVGDGKYVILSSITAGEVRVNHIVSVIDVIKDSEGNPTDFVVNDSNGRMNMRKRVQNGGKGGYGEQVNEKNNPNSNYGKHNKWNIAEMESLGIRFNCEVYEKNSNMDE